jgi:hypothetical protein
MMQIKSRVWLAVGCLLVGIGGGAVGAQVIGEVLRPSYLNSGMFSMQPNDTAEFFVTLDDNRNGAPAQVRLQFLDSAGTVVARQVVVLQAGQSTSLRLEGPGSYRAHAQVLDPGLQLLGRRTVVGTVEVVNFTTGTRGPVCSIDYSPVGAGRQ